MYEESEASYQDLFNSLKTRGIQKVWLVVSDAHKGLVSAVQKSFIGASWQRDKVHFMRNIMAHVPAKNSASFTETWAMKLRTCVETNAEKDTFLSVCGKIEMH